MRAAREAPRRVPRSADSPGKPEYLTDRESLRRAAPPRPEGRATARRTALARSHRARDGWRTAAGRRGGDGAAPDDQSLQFDLHFDAPLDTAATPPRSTSLPAPDWEINPAIDKSDGGMTCQDGNTTSYTVVRFAFDVLACPACGGRLRLLATIEDRAVVEKILTHLGLPVDLPRPSAARPPEWLPHWPDCATARVRGAASFWGARGRSRDARHRDFSPGRGPGPARAKPDRPATAVSARGSSGRPASSLPPPLHEVLLPHRRGLATQAPAESGRLGHPA